ncbi:hypothetical protein [Marinicrinis sediminis]|uniref:Uncharacterized protein n=1 Tax=Marinicrinis sediminis TaxID=1652465 RepID=A0ABW5R7N2_9BACL
MFRIRYLLTMEPEIASMDLIELEKEGIVSGYMELYFNEKDYGIYPDIIPPKGLQGLYLLSTWFEQLTEAVYLLSQSGIVYINDTESHNSWIELKRINWNELEASHVIVEEKHGGLLETKPLQDFEYGDWQKVIISYTEFKVEIVKKTMEFLQEIHSLNSNYSKISWVKRIVTTLEKITEL